MAKDIIKYQHKQTNICVRRYWNKTQLLFDDAVIDTWKGIVEVAYSLHGKIDNDVIDVRVTPNIVGENIRLSINGCAVDKAWKA